MTATHTCFHVTMHREWNRHGESGGYEKVNKQITLQLDISFTKVLAKNTPYLNKMDGFQMMNI